MAPCGHETLAMHLHYVSLHDIKYQPTTIEVSEAFFYEVEVTKVCWLIFPLQETFICICQILQITSISVRCLCSSAAVTPDKYELDIIQVTNVVLIWKKKWENNEMEKFGLVHPPPSPAVYPIKYVHGFIVLCLGMAVSSFIEKPCVFYPYPSRLHHWQPGITDYPSDGNVHNMRNISKTEQWPTITKSDTMKIFILYPYQKSFLTTFQNFKHDYIMKFYWSSDIFNWIWYFFIGHGPRTGKFCQVWQNMQYAHIFLYVHFISQTINS